MPDDYGLSELSAITRQGEYYEEAQYIIKNRLSLLDFDCWTYIEECLDMKVPYSVYSDMDGLAEEVLLDYQPKEIVALYEATKRNSEGAIEMAEYCEHFEPTYNPEDGSM